MFLATRNWGYRSFGYPNLVTFVLVTVVGSEHGNEYKVSVN